MSNGTSILAFPITVTLQLWSIISARFVPCSILPPYLALSRQFPKSQIISLCDLCVKTALYCHMSIATGFAMSGAANLSVKVPVFKL